MVDLLKYFKSKPQIVIKEVEKIVYAKSFNAAKIDRLNEDFRVAISKINEDIRNSLTNLRGRSRTSSQNNDYYIRFLSLFVNYVIGPHGFTLVEKGKDLNGEIDKVGNSKVEKAFKDFGKKKYFTINNRETFYSFQVRCAYTYARDGEVFVRIHRGANNKYGVSFSIIDADFLDESFNIDSSELNNGNHICQGIELDSIGKAVRYHFSDPKEINKNYNGIAKGGKKIPIDAENIIHWYNKTECNQYRGFPPGQNLLLALHGLSELNESEMVSFRAGSCKMGFKQQKFPSDETAAFNPNAGNGSNIDEIQAGLIETLGPNEEFISYNPDHKSGNWETFSRGILRSASSGCGFPYPLLSNDYSGLDSDGVRLMINDARDFGISQQKLMIDDLIDPVYDVALPFVFLNGNIGLPFSKIDKFLDHEFRGRAYLPLRPLEEAQANQILWDCGGNSRTDYNRGLNKDTDDIFSELGYEEELSKFYGIPLRNQGGTMQDNIGVGGGKPSGGKTNEKE